MGEGRLNMNAVGYAYLQAQAQLPGSADFLGPWQARLAATQRIERLPDGTLLVPPRLAPPPGDLLQHALFALKHEGVRLDVLAACLPRLNPQSLVQAFQAAPNGVYIRKLCHLWEGLCGQPLPGLDNPGVAAAYAPLFDPDEWLTGPIRRDPRWRIDFNGLGDWTFCPQVRKTPALLALLNQDVLGQAHAFAESVGQAMLDRAIHWAYLSETEGSLAIEGEAPSADKAARFASVLRRAHEPRALTEEWLAELQNALISTPWAQEMQFRTEQNRLQGAALGAAGVSYVPPWPDLAVELMAGLMRLANHRPASLDVLVHAAVVSFAFVFIHPFMDGNGRLSRYLIHHCLGQSGRLPPPFLLPISVAMRKHEAHYLAALTAFSRPARQLCNVTWAGDEHYSYTWVDGAAAWFRYMDVTPGVEFVLAMAQAALDVHLREEVAFLALFDRVKRHIDARYDLRGSDLATLIVTIHQNAGVLSNNRRKRFAERVPAEVLDAIETTVQAALRGPLPDEDPS